MFSALAYDTGERAIRQWADALQHYLALDARQQNEGLLRRYIEAATDSGLDRGAVGR